MAPKPKTAQVIKLPKSNGVPMYENDLDFSKLQEVLPVPTGYHLLVAVPEVKESTSGGVLMPEEHLKREQTATIIGMVVLVGADCYADKTKFPNGPWCKQGDWVMMRSYAGTRMVVNGKEFRLINDDTVDAVVPDPRVIKRAI